jgi:transcriptional regulator with XRE-family HTH domain
MSPSAPSTATAPQAAPVLTKAVVRAARALELSQKTMAATLGVSEASVSRLTRGRTIDPASKEGELAILFVRLYRSLDSLLGGDVSAARSWMHARNLHLDATPADLIRTITGLTRALEYLDAMRGKS